MNDTLGEREILCVNQLTLCGDTRHGNRPSVVAGASSAQAEPLYARFRTRAAARQGLFGGRMAVELDNGGPDVADGGLTSARFSDMRERACRAPAAS